MTEATLRGLGIPPLTKAFTAAARRRADFHSGGQGDAARMLRAFLMTDLRESVDAAAAAAAPLSGEADATVPLAVLQVERVHNAGERRSEQGSDGSSRCLSLLLVDGHGGQARALERGRVAGLAVSDAHRTPLGAKLLVRDVPVRRGVLLLDGDNTKLLGGRVDRLERLAVADRARAAKEAERPTPLGAEVPVGGRRGPPPEQPRAPPPQQRAPPPQQRAAPQQQRAQPPPPPQQQQQQQQQQRAQPRPPQPPPPERRAVTPHPSAGARATPASKAPAAAAAKKPAAAPAPSPAPAYDKMTIAQLKPTLRSRGLPVTGTKAVLIKRLVDADDPEVGLAAEQRAARESAAAAAQPLPRNGAVKRAYIPESERQPAALFQRHPQKKKRAAAAAQTPSGGGGGGGGAAAVPVVAAVDDGADAFAHDFDAPVDDYAGAHHDDAADDHRYDDVAPFDLSSQPDPPEDAAAAAAGAAAAPAWPFATLDAADLGGRTVTVYGLVSGLKSLKITKTDYEIRAMVYDYRCGAEVLAVLGDAQSRSLFDGKTSAELKKLKKRDKVAFEAATAKASVALKAMTGALVLKVPAGFAPAAFADEPPLAALPELAFCREPEPLETERAAAFGAPLEQHARPAAEQEAVVDLSMSQDSEL